MKKEKEEPINIEGGVKQLIEFSKNVEEIRNKIDQTPDPMSTLLSSLNENLVQDLNSKINEGKIDTMLEVELFKFILTLSFFMSTTPTNEKVCKCNEPKDSDN